MGYTNCSKLQLSLNGKEIGGLQDHNDETGVIFWDIPFIAGKLEVIGYISGVEAARYSIETSNRPYAVHVEAVNKNVSFIKGVAQIEIQIVDESGKPVLLADDEVTCTTDGNVKLIGLEASNPTDMEDYTDNKQRVYHGKMIAYLQSSGKKGKSKVTFSSPWLKEAVIEINIE